MMPWTLTFLLVNFNKLFCRHRHRHRVGTVRRLFVMDKALTCAIIYRIIRNVQYLSWTINGW